MDDKTKELIKWYVKQGYSYRQIARMLGITHPTVIRALGKDKTEELYRKKYQSLPEDIKKLLGLIKTGIFGSKKRTYETLEPFLRKHGITNLNMFYILVKYSSAQIGVVDKEELMKWLRELGLSYERIGKLLGVSKPTVIRRLNPRPKKSKYQRIFESLNREVREEILKAVRGEESVLEVYKRINSEVSMSLTTFYRFIHWLAQSGKFFENFKT